MNPELDRKLRHLRLSGFVQALPVRNQEAINNHLAYVEFLELLVGDELARRWPPGVRRCHRRYGLDR